MKIQVPDASLRVHLSHLFYQGVLADQYTLDQLVVIFDGEGIVSFVIFKAKVLEVSAVRHFLFVKGPQVHQDVGLVLLHMFYVDRPSSNLLLPELVLGLAHLAMPFIEELVPLKYTGASLHGNLNQFLIEHFKLRKDG